MNIKQLFFLRKVEEGCYLSLATFSLSCVSAATSSSLQRPSSSLPQSNSFLNMSAANSISSTLPFITCTSSSSLLLRGPNMAPHQHTVTSSSSSYPQVSLSQQSISLADTDLLQWYFWHRHAQRDFRNVNGKYVIVGVQEGSELKWWCSFVSSAIGASLIKRTVKLLV